MSSWQAYVLVGVATVVGLLVFAGLRRREMRPDVAGCLAIAVPVIMVALVFGLVVLADQM